MTRKVVAFCANHRVRTSSPPSCGEEAEEVFRKREKISSSSYFVVVCFEVLIGDTARCRADWLGLILFLCIVVMLFAYIHGGSRLLLKK